MLLEPHDLDLFFRLHRTLMFFVNQRLKVIPDNISSIAATMLGGLPRSGVRSPYPVVVIVVTTK